MMGSEFMISDAIINGNGFNRDPLKLAKNVILHKVNKPLHPEITLMTMQFI